MLKGVVVAIVITLCVWTAVQLAADPISLPVYPGAYEVDSYRSGNTCSHKALVTSASPEVVLTFYRAAMLHDGWKPGPYPDDERSLSMQRSTLSSHYWSFVLIDKANSTYTQTHFYLNAQVDNVFDACRRSLGLSSK